MKKIGITALVCGLAFSAISAYAGDAIKTDPNTVPKTTPSIKTDTDERLAQRITYTAENQRLHKVLGEISAKTGLVINCGNSQKDWQVRDIPVTVCARDLPLGMLLKKIADSTHLCLSSSNTNGAWTYRIWRDHSRRKTLDDFVNTRRQAANAAIAWDWDFWSGLSDIAKSEAIKGKSLGGSMYKDDAVKALSRVVAELGEEGKQRVINGECLRLSLADSPASVRDDLLQVFRSLRTWNNSSDEVKVSSEPMPDLEIEQTCCLLISVFQIGKDNPGKLSIRIIKQHSPLYSSRASTKLFEAGYVANALQHQGVEFTPRPEVPGTPESDDPSSDCTRLNVETLEQRFPNFQAKVNLKAPKKEERPTFCNLASALAECYGCSIVAEDFLSYKLNDELLINYGELFDRDTTVAEILIKTGWSIDWWFDEQNKVLTGHAKDWTQRHINLVPESMIASLKQKLDSSGVELEDLLPLAPLNDRQKFEWFYSADFPEALRYNAFLLQKKTLWGYYVDLTTEQKKLAQSEKGLAIPEPDLPAIADLLQAIQIKRSFAISAGAGDRPMTFQPYDIELTSLQDVTNLIMRVTKIDYNSSDKHSWRIRLEGRRGEKQLIMSDELTRLPVYSPKREAELARQKIKK